MSRKFHVNMIKCTLQTNLIQVKHNKLRIPTGGRLTSWLFTSVEELNSGHQRQIHLVAGRRI